MFSLSEPSSGQGNPVSRLFVPTSFAIGISCGFFLRFLFHVCLIDLSHDVVITEPASYLEGPSFFLGVEN
jgi:hypothetical protein